jgi:hypothetical protein
MLKNTDKKPAALSLGAKLLVVHGRRFANTAAKFWSALIDELVLEYGGCRKVVLEAVNEGKLDSALLYPEIELERELNLMALNAGETNEAWQQALADFELYGPPGAVSMRLYSDKGELGNLCLPMDCVDAEIFLYLLVWLAEWGELPLHSWQDPEIKASFKASDPLRKLNYAFRFAITHQPLAEGLYTWKLELEYERTNI